MINIAVCDDNAKEAGQIESLLCQLQKELNIDLKMHVFLSGEELSSDLIMGQFYDIIFLDIEMDGIGGVEIGRTLRDSYANDNTQIIYVSIHDDYHEVLYSAQPIGFLKKPIDPKKFTSIFKYVLERIYRVNDTYVFKIGHDTYKVAKKDILYLEGSMRKVKLYTEKANFEYYGSISAESAYLPDICFLLVHQSYLVNLNKVTHFNAQQLMVGEAVIPISQHRRSEIRKKILNYMEDKMQWER